LDKNTAAILISSLLERIERDQTIGAVSSLERKALQIALAALHGEGDSLASEASEPAGPVSTHQRGTGTAVSGATSLPPSTESVDGDAIDASTLSTPALPTVAVALGSIERDEVTDPEVLLCLDFGTAMSKAFATVFPDKYLYLELGTEAGRQGYTLPSSVFIADDGKAYFASKPLSKVRTWLIQVASGWIPSRVG